MLDLEVGSAARILALGLNMRYRLGKNYYEAYTGDFITFKASKQIYKSYQWEFGDGNRTNESKSHIAINRYEEAGSYVVYLTVYDEVNKKSKTIYVDVIVKDTKIQMITSYRVRAVAISLFVFASVEFGLNLGGVFDESVYEYDD